MEADPATTTSSSSADMENSQAASISTEDQKGSNSDRSAQQSSFYRPVPQHAPDAQVRMIMSHCA